MNTTKDTRKIIGFDFDDVLFDLMSPLIDWHNEIYGTELRREDYFSFDFSEVWKCKGEDANERIFDFYQSEHYKLAVPITGAFEGLEILKNDYRFVIITARPDSMETVTRVWLDKHFSGLFDDIVFTNHYYDAGVKRTKSSVCTDLGVSLFIDDALHNALDVASAGIPVLLFDTPWNREELPELVTRVSSWNEIVENIKKDT